MLEKKIEHATFSKYDEIFSILTDQKINQILGQANLGNWNNLVHSFKLRNFLAHGQSLGMDLGTKKSTKTAVSIQFEPKLDAIINHFKRESLISKVIPEGTHFVDYFLNNKVADFTFKQSCDFIKLLDANLSGLGYGNDNRISAAFYLL